MGQYLAACTLALIGCAGTPPVDCAGVYTASGFTSSQLTTLQRAASRWQSFTGRPTSITPAAPSPTCHIAPSDTGPDGEEHDTSRTIQINRTTLEYSDELEAVALHELGHAQGLEHVPALGSVMSPLFRSGVTFTPSDRAECERVGACDVSRMLPR